MPAIKPSSIRELKDRINIYDVVSREVALKKAGSEYKGLSPFTSEKTPSFFISPDKGLYKCFSSGNAGDVISFVMEKERLTFTEAVETLAKRFNFELEYEEGGRPREDRSLRQELFDLHEVATDFYHDQFLASAESGRWIRDYWQNGRKFDLEVAKDFKIGLAPVNSEALGRLVGKRGFSTQAIEACGLFYTRRGTAPHRLGYRFRGRLMIPVRDHQSRVVAFTARQLEITPADDPSREAKYINSPETPIFSKSHLLFNLDRARMEVNEDNPFVMVEGQLDAIRCWSVGLKTAVAPQGTGITESQLRLLKRYQPELIVLLDGDSAGQKAALRLLPLAISQGIESIFIPLADKEDPDDIFREGGKDALDELLQRSLQPIPFATRSLAPNLSELTPQKRANVARELFSMISKSESSAVKVALARQASEELGLEPNAVLEDFNRFERSQRPAPSRVSGPKTPEKPNANEPTPAKSVYSVERDLLALCMTEGDLGERIARLVHLEWIDTSLPEGELLNFVLNEFLHDLWNGPDSLNEQLENAELRTLAAAIRFDAPKQEEPDKLADQALKRLASKFVERKTGELKLEIGRKQASNDAESLSLLGELAALNQLRSKPPQLADLHL